MNTTLDTLKVGDVLCFQYGVMCGEDFGTVLGFETDRWGTHAIVRKSDFSISSVETLRGTVTVKHGVDYEGNPYMSSRPVHGTGIGTYLVVG
jgi:hypothetical protein